MTLTVGAGEEFATLQAAANSVSAGDTVVVEAGSYAGFEMINRASGTAGLPIVFDFKRGQRLRMRMGIRTMGLILSIAIL